MNLAQSTCRVIKVNNLVFGAKIIGFDLGPFTCLESFI